MITRPLTWDVETAHEMWDANLPIGDIASHAGVTVASVMFQAHKRHWKRRDIGHERIYACIVCEAPNTAVRRNTRCPECSLIARHERNNTRYRPKAVIPIVPEVVSDTPSTDLDIRCYREHKQMRTDEIAKQLDESRIALEHQMALAKSKPGRRKKYKRGFIPNTFGRFAA